MSDSDVDDPAETRWAVDVDGLVKGLIQLYETPSEDYRNASIDVFLDESVHGMGLGREIVGAVLAHAVDVLGHHRVTIDPASDNAKAIGCYSACGFRPVRHAPLRARHRRAGLARRAADGMGRRPRPAQLVKRVHYSTVTDFARLRGWSTS